MRRRRCPWRAGRVLVQGCARRDGAPAQREPGAQGHGGARGGGGRRGAGAQQVRGKVCGGGMGARGGSSRTHGVGGAERRPGAQQARAQGTRPAGSLRASHPRHSVYHGSQLRRPAHRQHRAHRAIAVVASRAGSWRRCPPAASSRCPSTSPPRRRASAARPSRAAAPARRRAAPRSTPRATWAASTWPGTCCSTCRTARWPSLGRSPLMGPARRRWGRRGGGARRRGAAGRHPGKVRSQGVGSARFHPSLSVHLADLWERCGEH